MVQFLYLRCQYYGHCIILVYLAGLFNEMFPSLLLKPGELSYRQLKNKEKTQMRIKKNSAIIRQGDVRSCF